ncbi:hypothetical protein K457DRAFT_257767 [Linnemannia elongata AG-77]|uniref:Uncharacterized protein n=1 Tax=Linnemannia elongata AG-77 TaxID=1314771 RepID=A0A197K6X0_9FUNG|nr:hypothetical protein K457DRAFT_257767 [Linnemannia elongata AG-77]
MQMGHTSMAKWQASVLSFRFFRGSFLSPPCFSSPPLSTFVYCMFSHLSLQLPLRFAGSPPYPTYVLPLLLFMHGIFSHLK